MKELITDNPSCSIADYLAMGDVAISSMAEETKHSGLVASDIDRVFYDEDTGLIVHVCEHYLNKHRPHNQTQLDGVITNPVQRYYFNLTEYECRPQEEISDWLGVHYVAINIEAECYEVLCLDERNHDRATVVASFPNVFDAIEYVKGVAGGDGQALKAFMVGDNDIVFAYTEDQALELLNDYCGESFSFEDIEVDDMSDRLDMKLVDEDGKPYGVLGDCLAECNAPTYFVGWE